MHRSFSSLALLALTAGTAAAQATGGQTPAASMPAPAEQQGGLISGVVTAAAAPAANGKVAPGTPLPGVAVTATNSLTGKKYAAATDVNGSYRLLIPRNGRYVLRTEFAAFAPLTGEVLLNTTQHSGKADFALELASRVAARTATGNSTAADTAGTLGLSADQTQALGRGLQSLRGTGTDAESASDSTGTAGVTLGSLSGDAASASDSVAVNGQAGQTNGLANLNEDDVRDRIQNAIADARRNGGAQGDVVNAVVGLVGGLIAGGPGGPGGFGGPGGGGPGGRGGGGGRGSFRNFNPTQVHGNLFYGGGNGALDATQFSLTGNAVRPAYDQNRYGINLTGSPYIPGLFKPSSKQFAFINITGQRNSNPVNIYGTVPTDAQRLGNFSGFTRTVSGVASPVTLYDPATGTPFGCVSAAQYATNPGCATNVIPATRLSPQALALLNYYPHANSGALGAADTAQLYNYQRIATQGQNTTQIAARFQRALGSNATSPFGGFGGRGGGTGGTRGNRQQANQKPTLRQSVNANFSYSHNASDIRNFAPSLDGKSVSDGFNTTAGYTLSYGRFNESVTLTWNRSHADTSNLFTGSLADPGAGFNLPKPASITPGFYSGIPTIGLTDFNSLTETNPADRVQQTISGGDSIRYNHKRHNMNFGFDVRRVENNVIGGTNVVGSFTFSGIATQAPAVGTSTGGSTSTPTGSSFADFLLGAPQQSKIQAGLQKIHLRETVYDMYANDDWRAMSNLTLNYGLRYEYFGPYTETQNQLVNLDHSADFTAVAPVLPNGTGLYSGKFPASLVNADRALISPRFGLAYRPKFVKQTVLRAGYGISYNTQQFGSFANSLSYQVPFAVTQTNVANENGCGSVTAPGSSGTAFTLTSAFNCNTAAVTNNFAVNKDYRLGRVQVVNAGVQHTFGFGILLNVDYNGSFGGNLDVLRAPGHTANVLTVQNADAFTFEDSVAESRSNVLAVNLRKRMSRGIAMQATYTYGHSIDDASSFSGGAGTVVQDDQHIEREFGNSTFDIRHRVNGNFVAELPFGPNRAFLHSGGFLSKALDGFNVSGNYTLATGTYATPQYQNTAAQLATGGNYTLRPDRVFTQAIAGAGTLHSWFNTAAFVAPAADSFGDASRNSIRLPGTVSVDMSLSRTVNFGDLKNFEARATATNVFNTVQYSGVNTVLNSSTFGQVTSTSQSRRISFNARYRF